MFDADRHSLPSVLLGAYDEAVRFLGTLESRPAALDVPEIEPLGLPETAGGASAALAEFVGRYAPWMSGSAGPRYFGFVTGGTTPAALVGDWLAATYDQNLADVGTSGATQLALDALSMVRDLLGLPDEFGGAFVTGATGSSLAALAAGREWVGNQRGVSVTRDGAHALGPVPVLSGAAHSSIPKVLSVLGLGRSALHTVPTQPDREAVDVSALDAALSQVETDGAGPALVVANAGTVNTCDFDDLESIAALRERHTFWLHVDGAFGAIAAASPRYRPLLAGLDRADSVTVDAHKWLNVPYESGVVFTRHLGLQGAVFQNAGAYLPSQVRPDTFGSLTPEGSQRLRALPTWMTLAAYGRSGYAAIVERCCDLAAWLGGQIEASDEFELLAPVRLNGVCFTLAGAPSTDSVAAFLVRVREDGTSFLTPTTYAGTPSVRASITNWRTDREDVERTWAAMQRAVTRHESRGYA